MRMNNRIRKLERAAGITGPCPLCGGRGRGCVVFSVDGADLDNQGRTGCPACGKERVVKRIVMDGLSAEQLHVLRFLARGPVAAA